MLTGGLRLRHHGLAVDNPMVLAWPAIISIRRSPTSAPARKVRSHRTAFIFPIEIRDQFIKERHRMEETRVRCEQQKDWRDWVVLGILLLAMVIIGILIGCKWR